MRSLKHGLRALRAGVSPESLGASRPPSAGGGLAAILYSLKMGRRAGGTIQLYKRMRARNACKTCALGMGGQKGGMVNEAGHFPEVCKKSLQAQAADMQPAIREPIFRSTPIAMLERFSSRQLESLGRLAFPIIAEPGATHFRRLGWDEALDRAARALEATPPDEFFLYVSGRSSNEAGFLAQLIARAYGTANIHNCSYYCHQASGVALKQIYGSGTASVTLDDLDRADLALVIGANPASNHPRMITKLMALRRRGGRVIVINPLKELGLVRFRVPSDWRSLLFGSEISDLYLQPKVGSDIALLKALLKGVLEREGLDERFVSSYTRGWDAVRKDVEGASWDDLISASGVARREIDRGAEMISGAERGLCLWAMGLTHHVHGVDNILALGNLALARGWLGRRGTGFAPIRGHSNVQGVGSVGVTPGLKSAFAAKLESLYGISVPDAGGQDTYASMQAAERGQIRSTLWLGGNLYGSNPDAHWAKRALEKIPFAVQVSTKLNTGHVQARPETLLILPALTRDEESQLTTQESMFNYVRISDGGLPHLRGEMRSEVEIIATLAERLLPKHRVDWSRFRSHATLRQAMSEVVPGYAAIGEVGEKSPPSGGEFQIEGRTFHEPRFSTPDGKAHFYVTALPKFAEDDWSFRLMTLRSEGQFNTVVYEDEDLYRGVSRRDAVLMSREDAERRGVACGERVSVRTGAGSMEASVALVDICPGSIAMYYPEANLLVPQAIDERSRTPAFKSVLAWIEPVAGQMRARSAVANGQSSLLC